jgi:NADH pyrophosphatase NudC (nudix superfamily)
METDDTIKSTQAEEIAEYKWFEVDDILMMKPNIEAFDFMIEMLEKIVGEDEEE